jgi:hypothetical protein
VYNAISYTYVHLLVFDIISKCLSVFNSDIIFSNIHESTVV